MNKHYGLLAMLVLATLPCAAQTVTLYDDFDHRYINPALWNTVCGTSELSQECVIEIQDEHLRLARRVTGDPGSNTGLQYGQATAFFFNPVPIKGITADMVVRRIDEQPCAANPSFGSHGDIIARFFNAGNGTENDDVGASLSVGRAASDPKGQLTADCHCQLFPQWRLQPQPLARHCIGRYAGYSERGVGPAQSPVPL